MDSQNSNSADSQEPNNAPLGVERYIIHTTIDDPMSNSERGLVQQPLQHSAKSNAAEDETFSESLVLQRPSAGEVASRSNEGPGSAMSLKSRQHLSNTTEKSQTSASTTGHSPRRPERGRPSSPPEGSPSWHPVQAIRSVQATPPNAQAKTQNATSNATPSGVQATPRTNQNRSNGNTPNPGMDSRLGSRLFRSTINLNLTRQNQNRTPGYTNKMTAHISTSSNPASRDARENGKSGPSSNSDSKSNSKISQSAPRSRNHSRGATTTDIIRWDAVKIAYPRSATDNQSSPSEFYPKCSPSPTGQSQGGNVKRSRSPTHGPGYNPNPYQNHRAYHSGAYNIHTGQPSSEHQTAYMMQYPTQHHLLQSNHPDAQDAAQDSQEGKLNYKSKPSYNRVSDMNEPGSMLDSYNKIALGSLSFDQKKYISLLQEHNVKLRNKLGSNKTRLDMLGDENAKLQLELDKKELEITELVEKKDREIRFKEEACKKKMEELQVKIEELLENKLDEEVGTWKTKLQMATRRIHYLEEELWEKTQWGKQVESLLVSGMEQKIDTLENLVVELESKVTSLTAQKTTLEKVIGEKDIELEEEQKESLQRRSDWDQEKHILADEIERQHQQLYDCKKHIQIREEYVGKVEINYKEAYEENQKLRILLQEMEQVLEDERLHGDLRDFLRERFVPKPPSSDGHASHMGGGGFVTPPSGLSPVKGSDGIQGTTEGTMQPIPEERSKEGDNTADSQGRTSEQIVKQFWRQQSDILNKDNGEQDINNKHTASAETPQKSGETHQKSVLELVKIIETQMRLQSMIRTRLDAQRTPKSMISGIHSGIERSMISGIIESPRDTVIIGRTTNGSDNRTSLTVNEKKAVHVHKPNPSSPVAKLVQKYDHLANHEEPEIVHTPPAEKHRRLRLLTTREGTKVWDTRDTLVVNSEDLDRDHADSHDNHAQDEPPTKEKTWESTGTLGTRGVSAQDATPGQAEVRPLTANKEGLVHVESATPEPFLMLASLGSAQQSAELGKSATTSNVNLPTSDNPTVSLIPRPTNRTTDGTPLSDATPATVGGVKGSSAISSDRGVALNARATPDKRTTREFFTPLDDFHPPQRVDGEMSVDGDKVSTVPEDSTWNPRSEFIVHNTDEVMQDESNLAERAKQITKIEENLGILGKPQPDSNPNYMRVTVNSAMKSNLASHPSSVAKSNVRTIIRSGSGGKHPINAHEYNQDPDLTPRHLDSIAYKAELDIGPGWSHSTHTRGYNTGPGIQYNLRGEIITTSPNHNHSTGSKEKSSRAFGRDQGAQGGTSAANRRKTDANAERKTFADWYEKSPLGSNASPKSPRGGIESTVDAGGSPGGTPKGGPRDTSRQSLHRSTQKQPGKYENDRIKKINWIDQMSQNHIMDGLNLSRPSSIDRGLSSPLDSKSQFLGGSAQRVKSSTLISNGVLLALGGNSNAQLAGCDSVKPEGSVKPGGNSTSRASMHTYGATYSIEKSQLKELGLRGSEYRQLSPQQMAGFQSNVTPNQRLDPKQWEQQQIVNQNSNYWLIQNSARGLTQNELRHFDSRTTMPPANSFRMGQPPVVGRNEPTQFRQSMAQAFQQDEDFEIRGLTQQSGPLENVNYSNNLDDLKGYDENDLDDFETTNNPDDYAKTSFIPTSFIMPIVPGNLNGPICNNSRPFYNGSNSRFRSVREDLPPKHAKNSSAASSETGVSLTPSLFVGASPVGMKLPDYEMKQVSNIVVRNPNLVQQKISDDFPASDLLQSKENSTNETKKNFVSVLGPTPISTVDFLLERATLSGDGNRVEMGHPLNPVKYTDRKSERYGVDPSRASHTSPSISPLGTAVLQNSSNPSNCRQNSSNESTQMAPETGVGNVIISNPSKENLTSPTTNILGKTYQNPIAAAIMAKSTPLEKNSILNQQSGIESLKQSEESPTIYEDSRSVGTTSPDQDPPIQSSQVQQTQNGVLNPDKSFTTDTDRQKADRSGHNNGGPADAQNIDGFASARNSGLNMTMNTANSSVIEESDSSFAASPPRKSMEQILSINQRGMMEPIRPYYDVAPPIAKDSQLKDDVDSSINVLSKVVVPRKSSRSSRSPDTARKLQDRKSRIDRTHDQFLDLVQSPPYDHAPEAPHEKTPTLIGKDTLDETKEKFSPERKSKMVIDSLVDSQPIVELIENHFSEPDGLADQQQIERTESKKKLSQIVSKSNERIESLNPHTAGNIHSRITTSIDPGSTNLGSKYGTGSPSDKGYYLQAQQYVQAFRASRLDSSGTDNSGDERKFKKIGSTKGEKMRSLKEEGAQEEYYQDVE